MDITVTGARAAKVGVLMLMVALVGLTVHQWDYLRAVGWSAVSRTPTEWPSLLATGPDGWLLSVAFVCSALCTLIFAWALIAASRLPSPGGHRAIRLAGLALFVTAIGLTGIAFPADPPDATTASWHADVHNGFYPAVPFGALLAAGALALGGDSTPGRTGSRVLLPLMIGSFALTNVDAIAQLARYPAFGCLMVWIVVVSSALSRQLRRPLT